MKYGYIFRNDVDIRLINRERRVFVNSLVDRTMTRNDCFDTTPVSGKPVHERGVGVKKLSEGAHVMCIPGRFKE